MMYSKGYLTLHVLELLKQCIALSNILNFHVLYFWICICVKDIAHYYLNTFADLYYTIFKSYVLCL